MEQHTIIYEGLEMTVFGAYDQPEESTGYKGGWSTELIEVNGIDIYWMLNEKTIEQINDIIVYE